MNRFLLQELRIEEWRSIEKSAPLLLKERQSLTFILAKKEEENGGENFHLLLRDPYSIVLYLRMELVGEGKSY